MASNSFIPASNVKFHNWQANFVNVVNDNLSGWQLSQMALNEWNALTLGSKNKKTRWEKSWNIVGSRNFNRSQQEEMLAARKSYEFGKKEDAADTSLRIFISRYLRNNPLVSNEQKREMGLTVPESAKNPTSAVPSGGIWPEYLGTVAWGTHLIHHNEIEIPGKKSRAKVKGVENIEVFIALTEASVRTPPAMKDFAYDGTVNGGRYVRVFRPDEEAMRAWYYVRLKFKNSNHSYGPPSEFWNSVIM